MKTATNIICTALGLFALACFTLAPAARAVSPPPDGGYPGGNTAEGDDALFSLTTGTYNTAIGFEALYSNTGGGSEPEDESGDYNSATGFQALYSNTTGFENTATGFQALFSNTTGFLNTATGIVALYSNTTGDRNTATGRFSLFNNTTGFRNTATGNAALNGNTTGAYNTATGNGALVSNTTASYNTATGHAALISNTTGDGNTADGVGALANNTTGRLNTAIGADALDNNTGNFNTALGLRAGSNLTAGNNNIDIGNIGVAAESDTIRIGMQVAGTDHYGELHPAHRATYVAGVMGKTSPKGTPVFINANGQLGTATSSARFKDAIKSMDKASEAILALKPVTFHYKKELDPEGIPQFGLVAEDVAKVNPDLVVCDAHGKVYTVRYEAVNAMLLNEFLKEHRRVEQQEATIAQLKATAAKQEATAASQQKQIEALTDGLQKVSAQVEMSKPAPRVVDKKWSF